MHLVFCARCTTGDGVGAHCICAREGTYEVAAAPGGYIIRPYRVRRVGVDALIDPCRVSGLAAAAA